MSEITINELPTEILINIFSYLRCPALINAALTCKLWKELVDDSSLWCVSLNYHMLPDRAKCDYLRTTNRKFHTIKIRGDLRTFDDFGLIQRLGRTVVKLMWSHSADVTKFGQVLHRLPNLEHISLFEIVVVDHYNDDLPELCKLENLELWNCKGNILEVFQRARLKRFKLDLHFRTPVGLREFLVYQQDVRTALIVNQCDFVRSEAFSFHDLSILNLRLTNLSLFGTGLERRSHEILPLLEANIETLTELEVGSCLTPGFYEFVFEKLKKLKSLKMRVCNVPKEIKFYERLHISYLNNLTLIEPPVPCEYFFMRLPDITSLTLLRSRKHFLKTISDKLSNLTTLCLDSGDQLTTDQIRIPSMTTLHIYKLSHKIDWDEFTKDNHQLTELIIDSVERKEFLNILDIDCITENTRLRVLSIGKCFTASEHMLSLIRRNCPLLRVLSLG